MASVSRHFKLLQEAGEDGHLRHAGHPGIAAITAENKGEGESVMAWHGPYRTPIFLFPLLVALLVAGCGLPPDRSTGSLNVGATQTRNVEMRELATARALAAAITTPIAVTPTPHAAATHTRTAELGQLATLTAPTPTQGGTATAPAAPSPATGPAEVAASIVTFVGRVASTEALVGVITNGEKTTVYVCDGSATARWFSGTVTGNRLEVGSQDGAVVTAELPRGVKEVSGTLKLPDGTALAFGALATTGKDNAGIYRATGTLGGENFTMGVIVLPDNQFAGILRRGQTLHGVTNPSFAQGGLTATAVGLSGTFSAPRMTQP